MQWEYSILGNVLNGDSFKCRNVVYSPDFLSDPNPKRFISCKTIVCGIWHISSERFIHTCIHRPSSPTIARHLLYSTTFTTTFVINSTCMSSERSRHSCCCVRFWAEWKLHFLFFFRRSPYPEIRVVHIFFHICKSEYANQHIPKVRVESLVLLIFVCVQIRGSTQPREYNWGGTW
jgi:hypothetical protein